jgi:succinyl-CoA synthetase alpha subunit
MSVLVDKNTRVLVQGLGKTGQFHTDKAIAYGTQMVAAVHPSRAGAEFHFEGETDHSGVPGRDDSYSVELPVFATVKEAVAETGANASVVYVPPPFAADAIMEAAAAGHRAGDLHHRGDAGRSTWSRSSAIWRAKTRLVGPNCPGSSPPGNARSASCPAISIRGGRSAWSPVPAP